MEEDFSNVLIRRLFYYLSQKTISRFNLKMSLFYLNLFTKKGLNKT